jgi:hypothetical protein
MIICDDVRIIGLASTVISTLVSVLVNVLSYKFSNLVFRRISIATIVLSGEYCVAVIAEIFVVLVQ